jgi:hypothetical protein
MLRKFGPASGLHIFRLLVVEVFEVGVENSPESLRPDLGTHHRHRKVAEFGSDRTALGQGQWFCIHVAGQTTFGRADLGFVRRSKQFFREIADDERAYAILKVP